MLQAVCTVKDSLRYKPGARKVHRELQGRGVKQSEQYAHVGKVKFSYVLLPVFKSMQCDAWVGDDVKFAHMQLLMNFDV